MKLSTGMLLIALAAASWGTIGVAVEVFYRVAAADPVSTGFWRIALSVPPLLLLGRAFAGPSFWRFERRDLGPLVLMGAAFAAYQVCYFAAIPYIGVAAAVLINICSAPGIIALLSGAFLGERLTPVVGGVLIVAVIGAGLLVSGSPEADSLSALMAGGALALGAGFAYSLVALTARLVAPRYHPVQPIALAFSLSMVLLLPVVLSQGLAFRYPLPGWLLLLYLGLVPTAFGYTLYLLGLRRTPATIAAIVALLEPLISALLAIFLLGERLSPGGVLGGALLLGSVAFLYLHQSRGAMEG